MDAVKKSRSKPGRSVLVSLCLLLAMPLSAAEMLSVRFTSQPPGAGTVYSSDAHSAVRELRVQEGQSVSLQVQQGRRYETRAGGWYWTQVQQVPEKASAVSVTPRLDAEVVTLTIDLYRQDGQGSAALNTVVSGALGEWLTVLGPQQHAPRGGNTYSSGGSGDPLSPGLYVNVQRLPHVSQ